VEQARDTLVCERHDAPRRVRLGDVSDIEPIKPATERHMYL
jgi:hypothetical protein